MHKRRILSKLLGYVKVNIHDNPDKVIIDYDGCSETFKLPYDCSTFVIRYRKNIQKISVIGLSGEAINFTAKKYAFKGLLRRLFNKKKIKAHKIKGNAHISWGYCLRRSQKPIKMVSSPQKQKYIVSKNIQTLYHSLNYRDISHVAIAVPIYKAAKDVALCLQSLAAYTPKNVSIYLLDDCSNDPELNKIFLSYQNVENIHIIQHEHNMGFTKNVNSAFTHIPKDKDVILLNSDTIVGPRWVENLFMAAYSADNIATVTATSNSAGAFSVPELGVNHIPEWLNHEEISRLFLQESQRIYPKVPTGNGFCLYIRRSALNVVSEFDAGAFPRGYGEENDFCMKLLYKGFQHIIADNVYVYHSRTASFNSEEKEKNIKAGRAVLDERYPEYTDLIKVFKDGHIQLIRDHSQTILEQNTPSPFANKKRVLYIISPETGGTPQTNKDLMFALQNDYAPYLWVVRKDHHRLYKVEHGHLNLIWKKPLQNDVDPYNHTSPYLDEIFLSLVQELAIELVHMRHMIFMSTGFSKIAKKINLPLIFSLHDFYSLCPTINLLDSNVKYCDLNCHSVSGVCHNLFDETSSPINYRNNNIHNWRNSMEEFLKDCTRFISTVDNVKLLFHKAYPNLKHIPFQIIPHGREILDLDNLEPKLTSERKGKLKILVLGNINDQKGAQIFKELIKSDKNVKYEFHFLGDINPTINSIPNKYCTKWGKYNRGDLPRFIKKINPDIGVILSVWPETYCHTLTENWMFDIPVLGIATGAIKDRINQSQAGWLVDLSENIVSDIQKKLSFLSENPKEIMEKKKNTETWRKKYLNLNTTPLMASLYDIEYKKALSINSRHSHKKKVAIITHRDKHGNMFASSYIRMFYRIQSCQDIDFTYFPYEALSRDILYNDFDAWLLQRNCLPYKIYKQFKDKIEAFDKPIYVDIDDNLFIAESFGGNEKEVMSFFMKKAQKIFCSNKTLYNYITSKVTNNAIIRENKLSKSFTFRPHPKKDLSKHINILYMGTKTHAEDLQMIQPAVEMIKKEYEQARFYLVGGSSRSLEHWEKLPLTSNYFNFMIDLKSFAHNFNFAIAPLVDNEFNNNKSDLKFLDYTMLKIPGLYSNCLPYSDTVIHENTGILVNQDVQSWYEAMKLAIEKPSLMDNICENAYSFLIDNRVASFDNDPIIVQLKKDLF